MNNKIIVVLIFVGLISIVDISVISCNNHRSTSFENYLQDDGIIKNAVKDCDGNLYDAIKVGDQIWMASNLRVKHHPYGGEILNGHDISLERKMELYAMSKCAGEWSDYDELDEMYQKHLNKVKNNPKLLDGFNILSGGEAIYFLDKNGTDNNGLYYGGSLISDNDEGPCPEGWRVPTNRDWKELEDYLMRSEVYSCGVSETYVAKSLASTEGWRYYTQPALEQLCNVGCNPRTENNSTGFNAKPVGFAYYSSYDEIQYLEYGNGAYFLGDDGIRANGCYEVYMYWSSPILKETRVGDREAVTIRCIKKESVSDNKKGSKKKNNNVIKTVTEEISF
jgi:uncharacterized protein (TIGR02145 family)